MSKFILLNVKDYSRVGLYLQVEDNFNEEIKNITQANKFLKKYNQMKIQLRTKINNKRGKKNFTFFYNEAKTDKSKMIISSFRDLIEIIDSKRIDIKEKIIKGEKLKVTKQDLVIKNDNLTFLEVVEMYLNLKSISLREQTLIMYKRNLILYSKELHSKLFNSITENDIQTIINKLLDENKAPATVFQYATVLRILFKKYKLLNSTINLDNLELKEFNNRRDYKNSLEDTKRIIQAMRNYSKIDLDNNQVFYKFEEIKNIFAFCLHGRRISEIINLRFCDINLEDKTYKIVSTNAKGKKELDFIIDDYLLEAITSQARLRNVDLHSNSEAKIFTYDIKAPRVHFQKLLKDLNLPILRLHDVRHLIGTTLVQNGVPIQDISRMLGHSSISITEQRYAKTSKEQANRATSAFYNLVEI